MHVHESESSSARGMREHQNGERDDVEEEEGRGTASTAPCSPFELLCCHTFTAEVRSLRGELSGNDGAWYGKQSKR